MTANLNEQEKAVLDRLAEQSPDGLLHPAKIVAAAKKISSPLHRRFEWDDTLAAKKYRLDQARDLVEIYVEELPSGHEGRAYVSVMSDRVNGGGYQRTSVALSDAITRDELVRQMKNELRRVVERWVFLRPFAERLFKELDVALAAEPQGAVATDRNAEHGAAGVARPGALD